MITEKLEKEFGCASGFFAAGMTDRYLLGIWPADAAKIAENKLLEIRVFNETKEVKAFRSDISKEFSIRLVDDAVAGLQNGRDYSDYMDESQYLDIDTKRSAKCFPESHEVVTTGGGRYYLPADSMNDTKVIVRTYFDRYAETGQARVFDWRIVGFREEK